VDGEKIVEEKLDFSQKS